MSDTKTRNKVKFSELTGQTVLVERIGKAFNGQYGPSFPVDITLPDGTAAVTWVSGNSVCGRQITGEEIETNRAYTLIEVPANESKGGRAYRVLREAE